jgi:hypothetical protein
MKIMAWLFSASSLAVVLVLSGLGLTAWGLSVRIGPDVASMVVGVLLLWAGARVAKGIR